MREWLSGRALPCQGKCREFESRFPLQKENSRSETCCFLFGASPRVSTRQSRALPSFAFERQRKSGRGSAVQTRINPKELKAETAVSRKKKYDLKKTVGFACSFLFGASPRVSTRQSRALPSFAFERQRKSSRGSAAHIKNTKVKNNKKTAEATPRFGGLLV